MTRAAGSRYSNTLVVPATLGGELTTLVKKELDKSTPPMGFKTIVQEDGGRSVRADIAKTNPFPVSECGRQDCPLCQVEPSRGSCWVSNTVYQIQCNRSPCNMDGVRTPTYIGETSRTPYTRGCQHHALYIGKKDNSFQWKHTLERHGGVIGENKGAKDYKMKPLNKFKKSLTRVIEEAVRIQQLESDPNLENLNSRLEYFAPKYGRPSFTKEPLDY